MMFTFEERPDSRSSTTADPAGITYRFNAAGEVDDQVVRIQAASLTPASLISADLGTLFRQSIQVEPAGFALYVVTVPYTTRKQETGSYTWSFDTTGATVKVKAAKQHIASYPSGDPSDPHKGAIGVKKDGDVEGAEIIIPALKLNVSFRHPYGEVTMAYAKTLAGVTGMTNSEPFLDNEFAAGELLFLGASGSDGSEAEAEISYQFAASKNVTDLQFGEIVNIVKKGWHYAWVEFEDDKDNDEPITKPKRVHVERVYDETNFASVFGWG